MGLGSGRLCLLWGRLSSLYAWPAAHAEKSFALKAAALGPLSMSRPLPQRFTHDLKQSWGFLGVSWNRDEGSQVSLGEMAGWGLGPGSRGHRRVLSPERC